MGTTPFSKKVRSAVRVSATKAPFSPVMTVTRSFIGDSQFTRWLVTVPSASWPVIATRSSWGRPERCAVRARHAGVGLLRHPRGQVDVVGGQVEDHAHVSDPAGERALAAGGDLVDLPEVTVGDPGAGLLQRRVVALDVADCPHQPGRREGRGDLPGGDSCRR